MKATFVHDNISLLNSGNVYSNGLSYEVWKRYLSVFDQLTVCTRQKSSDKKTVEKISLSSGDNVQFRPCLDYQSQLHSIIRYRKIKNHLKSVISSNDCCIIRLPSTLGFFAVKICKELKIPYLIEMVACPWDSLWNYSLLGKGLAPIHTYLTRKYVKSATHVIYVTKEFLQNRYPTNGESIDCSDVNLTSFNVGQVVRGKKSSKKDYKIATTAAVNVRFKGQEYVIKALSYLIKKGYDITYYLAGGGDNSYLKSVAEEYNVENNVVFLGALPHDKICEFLDTIDIYIQPSKQEGLPRAMIEALSRGCPVIGAKVGGIPELCSPKYIFSSRKASKIGNMIVDISREIENESERSLELVKEYNVEILSKKRYEFLLKFKENIK